MQKEPLRVLLMAGRLEVRGSTLYTLRLLEHLPEESVAVRLACSSLAGVSVPALTADRVLEHRYLEAPLLGRLALRRLIRWIGGDRPDLVHVQNRAVLPAAIELCDCFDVPYVVTVHDFLRSHDQLRIDPRWARRLVAVSDAVKADLVQRGGLPERLIEVIPSGVDVPPLREPAEASPGREAPTNDGSWGRVPVVGTAGPLEAVKGHAYFLRAAQQILAQGIDAEFLIAGRGPEEANLRRAAAELRIADHVTFAPYVREYGSILEAMDIFCLPSLQQGLGTVMLEAMALGKPVIATGVGGVHSIVRNRSTGLLVPRRNAGALAESIAELLQNPALARALGRGGRELVAREFSVRKMIEATAAMYREVLAESRPAADTAGVLAVR